MNEDKVRGSNGAYLIQIALAAFRIEDCRFVAVMKQMTCCNETITAIVPRTASNQYARASLDRMDPEDCCGVNKFKSAWCRIRKGIQYRLGKRKAQQVP
jgi:hypothetical protein